MEDFANDCEGLGEASQWLASSDIWHHPSFFSFACVVC